MRRVVSNNIKRAMQLKYAGMPHHQRLLYLDVKKINDTISLSTVQRAIKGDVAATTDTLEAIAAALGIKVFQLFLEDTAVDVATPSAARQPHVLHERSARYAPARERVSLPSSSQSKTSSTAAKRARKT